MTLLVHYYDPLAFELNESPEPGSGGDYQAMCSSRDRGICKVSWRPDWVNCPECLSLLEALQKLEGE